MFRTLNWIFTVSVLLACSGKSHASSAYKVIDIGTTRHVYADGLNENNEVVGYVKPLGSWQNAYAFFWSVESGLTSIGGYRASDINDLGQIAGQTRLGGLVFAAVWDDGSLITFLDRQEVSAINNHGQVTGLISAQPYIPGPYAPFRDDDIHSPGFVELVRPYPRASHGFDINNKGEVVADCGTVSASFLYVGVFYRLDGSYMILDNDGNYDAHARAINDLSQIVGNSMISFGSDHLAVFWNSPSSQLEYMGALGDGHSVAYAINISGVAVGFSSDRAFLWSKQEGMVDLNTLIDPELGVTLTRATDINNRGVITAWGVDRHSYLLMPEGNGNDCFSALEAFLGDNLGANVGFGPDDAEASCQPDSNHDAWFAYTAPCSAEHLITTNGSLFEPSNDTILSIYDACGGIEIACDDDSGDALLSALTFDAELDTTYYIRVAGFGDNVGQIVLNISTLGRCLRRARFEPLP